MAATLPALTETPFSMLNRLEHLFRLACWMASTYGSRNGGGNSRRYAVEGDTVMYLKAFTVLVI